ncbi:MAG: glycoside hydrolase family 127 protein, partial [Candidatus Aminicenantes bacterium]|nr:glycoside hydrolase family 127 protein [Candidatus Aminicenantes bacterium]
AAGPVRLEQTTDYPWSGDIRVTVAESAAAPWTLMIRIPGWAQGRPVPSDLYRYAGETAEAPSITVNGDPVALEIDKGYVAVARSWTPGDAVEISLPLSVRRVLAHPDVREDVGRVAVERGPLVYAAEWPDNDGFVSHLVLPDESVLTPVVQPDLLGGVTVLTADGESYRYQRRRVVSAKTSLTLIPYYAWAHRGPGEMAVWLAREPGRARPIPEPTLASEAKVAASEGARGAEGVHDQFEPAHSNDQSGSPLHWWPRKGTREWVAFDFGRSVRVSEVEVYWFDDSGQGECRVPASWALLYKEGEAWTPVEDASAFGVVKDRYNTVVFRPVRTTALRIEIQLPEGFSSGILEWKVR